MSNKKLYIGAICNRDLEIFEEIKRFSRTNYNIKIVNFFKNSSPNFSLKYFLKKLKKHRFSLIIVKLFSEDSNKKIYDALEQYAPHIPRLNSINSVRTCESRKQTFKLIESRCKKLNIPKCYYSVNAAYIAVSNGIPLIIKLDTHNIRNLSKFDRIVGIAKNPEVFLKLIKQYDVQNNILFFQEYLGEFEIVHKVYVIDNYVQTVTSQNLLRQHKFTPAELVHVRVPIEKDLKMRIKRIGRKFGMSVYGIDYILKDGIPYIIDINAFPSYRYIHEAVSLISDYVFRFIEARQTLTKIPMSLKVKTYMT
ncbi:MAG: hypothetical protein ACTSP6_00635 [Promethearchaeota archaeon]